MTDAMTFLAVPETPKPSTDYERLAPLGLWESCRECRDELPWLAPAVTADFILWGKLFPPEAFGPRCYDHAAKWIGPHGMAQIDQWAVFDLRPARKVALATTGMCRNGHPFKPGIDVDMEREGRSPDPQWCDVCGELRDSS